MWNKEPEILKYTAARVQVALRTARLAQSSSAVWPRLVRPGCFKEVIEVKEFLKAERSFAFSSAPCREGNRWHLPYSKPSGGDIRRTTQKDGMSARKGLGEPILWSC